MAIRNPLSLGTVVLPCCAGCTKVKGSVLALGWLRQTAGCNGHSCTLALCCATVLGEVS